MDVVKLRPGRPADRQLVIPLEAGLHPVQIIDLLRWNGFVFEDLDKAVPRLRNHSELERHPDKLVYLQWDDNPKLVVA